MKNGLIRQSFLWLLPLLVKCAPMPVTDRLNSNNLNFHSTSILNLDRTYFKPNLISGKRGAALFCSHLANKRGGALCCRGGGDTKSNVVKTPIELGRKTATMTYLDHVIKFLDNPLTDMAIGTIAFVLTVVEIIREFRRSATFGSANYGLLSLAFARLLKGILSVLKSTKQTLRGYKAFVVVRRGDNIFLRATKTGESDALA